MLVMTKHLLSQQSTPPSTLELVVLLVSRCQRSLSLSCVVIVVAISGDGQLIAATAVADDNNSLTLWSWPSCWLCINGCRGRGRWQWRWTLPSVLRTADIITLQPKFCEVPRCPHTTHHFTCLELPPFPSHIFSHMYVLHRRKYRAQPGL